MTELWAEFTLFMYYVEINDNNPAGETQHVLL